MTTALTTSTPSLRNASINLSQLMLYQITQLPQITVNFSQLMLTINPWQIKQLIIHSSQLTIHLNARLSQLSLNWITLLFHNLGAPNGSTIRLLAL